MSLAGKVALITGGVGGLGKAFARSLLKNKITAVCLVDVSKHGQTTAAELSSQYHPSTVDFIECDVTNYQRLKDVFEHLKSKYGGVDIVCNNAGIPSMDHDVQQSTKAMRINLEAVYFGTQLGVEYMDKDMDGRKERGGGVVINVASMAAYLPMYSSMVYTGTKAGVVGLTKAAGMPENFAMHGVRVNAICPSFTETPILDSTTGLREVIESLPNHQILEPDYVAEGFLQLVQDEKLCGAIMRVTPQRGIDFAKASMSATSKL